MDLIGVEGGLKECCILIGGRILILFGWLFFVLFVPNKYILGIWEEVGRCEERFLVGGEFFIFC